MNRAAKPDPRTAIEPRAQNAGSMRSDLASVMVDEQAPPQRVDWLYTKGSNRDVPRPETFEAFFPLGGRTKRMVDIVIASVTLALLAPLMIITTCLIRFTIGGPVIFAHPRIGYGGKQFKCYKFRTMPPDADEILRRHLASNPEAEQEWRQFRKLKKDPRVSFVGHLLRKSSIDELPQLINVLLGDMSCVGPRPIVRDELEYYGINCLTYMKARPGLTGLWQVSGRNTLSFDQRVSLDCAYVRSWSIWTDFRILAATATAVMNSDETS